jgi:hypothetical protein
MFSLSGYKKKWVLPDLIIVLDVLQNALNSHAYEAIATWLGIEPSTVNSIVSIIELARFAILAHGASKSP